jgi:hypothetical protein
MGVLGNGAAIVSMAFTVPVVLCTGMACAMLIPFMSWPFMLPISSAASSGMIEKRG